MSETEQAHHTAWQYGNGTFSAIPDPCEPFFAPEAPKYPGEERDYDEALRAAGYSPESFLGEPEYTEFCAGIREYRGPQEKTHVPRYLVNIEIKGTITPVYINDFPDLLELLVKIAPAITAALLTSAQEERRRQEDM